ncbi:MAG: sulfatase-like hydrolase/transferase, partial [Candidatus Marinimicrobia bacterium]|nr:sulfatase-like hydrolase/transferase [Candidatus Neomarinimicrobiota bacterium]
MFRSPALTQSGSCRSFPRHLLLKRTTLVGTAIAAFFTQVIYIQPVSAKPSIRPNIILIMCDDMGWSDIGCYGGEVKTPNLDKLAAEGLRMTQMHNTSKCFPSRACLLTGVYAQQCGMDKSFERIRNAMTLGEVLRGAGYRTLAAGKHHCKESLYDRGFDRYFGLRDGCCNFFNPGLQRPGEGIPSQKKHRPWCIDDKQMTPYTPPEKDFYTTDYFTNYAISYIEEYKDEDKPFLLYLAYNAPHDPLQAWPEDIAKYQGKYMKGYAAIREERYARQKKMGLVDASMPLSAPTFTDWNSLSDEKKVDEDLKMAIYAAMIDRVDQNIGRLLDTLKTTVRYDTPLIMFSSDNG